MATTSCTIITFLWILLCIGSIASAAAGSLRTLRPPSVVDSTGGTTPDIPHVAFMEQQPIQGAPRRLRLGLVSVPMQKQQQQNKKKKKKQQLLDEQLYHHLKRNEFGSGEDDNEQQQRKEEWEEEAVERMMQEIDMSFTEPPEPTPNPSTNATVMGTGTEVVGLSGETEPDGEAGEIPEPPKFFDDETSVDVEIMRPEPDDEPSGDVVIITPKPDDEPSADVEMGGPHPDDKPSEDGAMAGPTPHDEPSGDEEMAGPKPHDEPSSGDVEMAGPGPDDETTGEHGEIPTPPPYDDETSGDGLKTIRPGPDDGTSGDDEPTLSPDDGTSGDDEPTPKPIDETSGDEPDRVIQLQVKMRFFVGYDKTSGNGGVRHRVLHVRHGSSSSSRQLEQQQEKDDPVVPTDAEIETLIQNTFNCFNDLLVLTYPDNFHDVEPVEVNTGPTSKNLGYELNCVADIKFGEDAPPPPPAMDIVDMIDNINSATFLDNCVHPSGPYFAQTREVQMRAHPTST